MQLFDILFATKEFRSGRERAKYEDLFESYMSDVPKNFYLDQFSLAEKYPDTNYEDWVALLTYKAFDSWKQQQIALIASTATDRALAGVDESKDTLQLLKMRQDVLNAEKKVEKPTIIVIPEDLFFKGDT